MGKNLGKILGSVVPIAAGFIPGIGPLASAAIGAGGGLLSGGGIKGALSGALSSGLGSGLGSQLGSGLNSSLGLGLNAGGALEKSLGNGLLGAASGGISNGLGGAALGGGLAGLGSYANAGGFDGTALGRLGDSVSSGLGDIFGTSAKDVQGPLQPGAAPLGKAGGTGIIGSLTGSSSLGSALGSGAGGGSSSYSSYIPAGLGALNSYSANSEAQKALLKSQQKAMGVLNPYLASGTAANQKLSDLLGTSGNGTSTADILASDPSYKFQLEQGNQALDRQQAARGGYFSGAALKAGQDYAQGLANKTVNDYYNKLAQQSSAGQQAAGSAGEIFGNTGSTRANASIANANNINQLLGSLFGAGAYGRRYDQYGNPIYA